MIHRKDKYNLIPKQHPEAELALSPAGNAEIAPVLRHRTGQLTAGSFQDIYLNSGMLCRKIGNNPGQPGIIGFIGSSDTDSAALNPLNTADLFREPISPEGDLSHRRKQHLTFRRWPHTFPAAEQQRETGFIFH